MFAGCGDDAANSSAETALQTGVLYDDVVEGLEYYTATQSGITDDLNI